MNLTDAPALQPIGFGWADKLTDDGVLSGLEEIVEDIATRGGMSVWYGEAHSGKTTLLIDLACHVASGRPWLGKRTVQCVVFYIALEGAASVERRLVAYRKHHGQPIFNFGVVSSALNLMEPSGDVEELIELIKLKMAEFGPSEPKLGLIVVDTLARAMVGANENASEDMSRLIAAGDRIRQVTGAHVAFVHHSGKDVARGARGHSSLRAATDAEIEVTVDEATKVHKLRVEKQRDLGTTGMELSARFKVVELGHSKQWPDKPITACVVQPVDQPSQRMEALMREQSNQRADAIVVTGFKRLKAMGITPTDGHTSPDYLPRQILDKCLGDGFTREDLARAMGRQMAAGIFARGVVGQYSNRNDKFGLVLRGES